MKNTIYVVCPSQIVSGGPEALHQLVYYLNKVGAQSVLVYSRLKRRDYAIPKQYQKYASDYVLLDDIEDDPSNTVVLPETLNQYLSRFTKSKVAIWWLGVGSDSKTKKKHFLKKFSFKGITKFLHMKNKIEVLKEYRNYKRYTFVNERDGLIHLCASHYVFDYVTKKTTNNCYLCIEPISKQFLEKSTIDYSTHTSDVVLYNPARRIEFTKKIMEAAKDIQFKPIKGIPQSELFGVYSKAKLYIDFGDFPGAERIPKEAVVNGCSILTSRSGAAAFHGDVPIPEEYKIDAIEENIGLIIDKIRYMLNNYQNVAPDFKEYVDTVYNLENRFMSSLKSIFVIEK